MAVLRERWDVVAGLGTADRIRAWARQVRPAEVDISSDPNAPDAPGQSTDAS